MYRTAVFVAMLLTSVVAHASNWNLLKAYSDTALFFFDYDTVVKKNDSVTLWVKYVKDENSPDTDGSYSTAQRVVYFCKKRTVQVLTTSTYNKAQQFMQSSTTPGKENEAVPDSVGESILKEVCSSDFPQANKPVQNNDIYSFTKSYFTYVANAKNDPAPK